MKMIAILALAALLPFPAKMPSAAAEETATCATSGKSLQPIMSTHTLAPYPMQSVRGHEQGQTMLAVTIGIDGAPTDVTVTLSSGSERLDTAAVNHIKEHWRWQPPMEDCKPAIASEVVGVGWHIGGPPQAKAGLEMRRSYYPPGAAERLERGDTYLELSLDDSGTVKNGRIVYSSGFADLEDKALEVVKATPDVMVGQPAGTEIVLLRWSLPPELRKNSEFVTIWATLIRY
jgi:TonB family protein